MNDNLELYLYKHYMHNSALLYEWICHWNFYYQNWYQKEKTLFLIILNCLNYSETYTFQLIVKVSTPMFTGIEKKLIFASPNWNTRKCRKRQFLMLAFTMIIVNIAARFEKIFKFMWPLVIPIWSHQFEKVLIKMSEFRISIRFF